MTIECRIAGGRMLLPKEEGGDIDGEMRPITKDDAECFAAWNRDPLAASIPNGVYVVQQLPPEGDGPGAAPWGICESDGTHVFGKDAAPEPTGD